jgi:hypothetical protein
VIDEIQIDRIVSDEFVRTVESAAREAETPPPRPELQTRNS